MKELFLLVLLFAVCSVVQADENYVVNGGDVYKIETISVDAERTNLNAELIQATAQAESYQQNIVVQQDGLAKAQALKKDIQDKLDALGSTTPEVVETPIVVDKIIY